MEKLVRIELLDASVKEYAPTKEDEKVAKYDLALNVNPYGVSEKVLSKLKVIGPKVISSYYPENVELIKEIASYVGASPEQIMLGDGGDGCLGMIAQTFVNRGDEVIIPTPTFHRYEFNARLMEGKPVFVPMKNFQLNSAEIINNVTPNSKIIFLCDPNNPTGISIDKNVKDKIIKNFSGIVVIDEALADAADINGTYLLKKYKNLIIVRSFSKTFGLASLRVGYIIAHPEIIRYIKKTSSPFKVNGVAQELAIEALRDKVYIESSKKYIQENRSFLISNLEKIGLPCTRSVTTNFLVDVSKICKNAAEIVLRLKEKGALVTDASIFRPEKDTYIRIAVARKEANTQFIRIFSDLVQESRQIRKLE